MKTLLIALLSGIITLSVTAQSITITFNGTNKNINYQAVVDGYSYYSNSSTYPINAKKEVVLPNQRSGSHKIVVYRLRANSGTYRNGTNTRPYGKAIYSKTFQVRQEYDMDIRINGNGRVMFSERLIDEDDQDDKGQNTISPMSDSKFDQLLQTVRSKYLQSSKITAERAAFLNTANYFTTEQVSQLLSLITSEAYRLELAKLAYPRVTDPASFTQLYEVFTSENSKNEMNIFIQNNPNYNNTNNNNNNGNWNNNTRSPMANYQFSQLLQTVNSQYNQAGKFNTISGAFNNNSNYFSTSQIRQLLSLINSEGDRLALAKLSYARVTDASSFTSLYDMFSQSSRDELHNFINGTNTQYTTRTAMADYPFNQLLQNVNGQWNQAGKFNAIRNAFNTTVNYFSTAQIRQLLSVMNAESDRLALAKLSYARVSDPANFNSLYDMFSSQANRNDLNNYVIQNGGIGITTTTTTTSRIPMTDALFNQLYQKASNHIRPSSIIEDLRQFFNNNSYNFSTAQIRQLLSLISSSILSPLASETDLLEVAKLSWHRVTDPANFPQLFSLFTIQANRDALNAYIQARPY